MSDTSATDTVLTSCSTFAHMNRLDMETTINLDDLQDEIQDRTRSGKNADPANWRWGDGDKALWEPAQEWQKLYTKWWGDPENQSASIVNPTADTPTLLLDLEEEVMPQDISSALLIRKSYLSMFDLIWAQSVLRRVRGGVILTGQPGTGKSLFLFYMLVRLLVLKQVILFCPNGRDVVLFCHDGVYTAGVAEIGNSRRRTPFPMGVPGSDVFVWSLFDIRDIKEPEIFFISKSCFPVQSASPDEGRYKTWNKERAPLITALPLWSQDELIKGLPYQNAYQDLLEKLSTCYKTSPPDLRKLKPYKDLGKILANHFCGDETWPSSPDAAIEYLLVAMVRRFGYAARDVYLGLFTYSQITKQHENIPHFEWNVLETAILTLSNQKSFTPNSRRLLSLSPVYEADPLSGVNWIVDFKSEWIARNIINLARKAERGIIRQQIRSYLMYPESRALAGRLLEPLVHHDIGNVTGALWPLCKMESNATDTDAPLFTLVRDTPVPHSIRLIKTKRKTVDFDSVTALSNLLENNAYYVPVDPTFPLIDSFTIELNFDRKLAILWLFQVTTSRRHGGSGLGYKRIREIMGTLKDALRGDSGEGPPPKKTNTLIPRVEVRYVLVFPKIEDESQSKPQKLQWQFPTGWNELTSRHDHRGQVYCLELPFTMQPE